MLLTWLQTKYHVGGHPHLFKTYVFQLFNGLYPNFHLFLLGTLLVPCQGFLTLKTLRDTLPKRCLVASYCGHTLLSTEFQGKISSTDSNVYLMEKRSSYDGIIGQACVNDHKGLLESYIFRETPESDRDL